MFDSMNEDISPKIDFQLADDIMHTGNWIEAKVTAHLRHYGLTYIQFNTLNVLKKSASQPMSVGELKDNTSFLNTDITRLVDRLVKKKLVNRNLSPTNRRKMEIMLSKKGVVLLQKINAEVKILIKDLFNNLSEEDTPPKAVLNLFKKVIL
jgi:DNA-binding MarR family transcriptional regulator